MAFSSVLPLLLPTHSVDCAVHLLLCHSRALWVNSALFLQFTALKCPFDGPFTGLKCPFDGPFTVLKCPFDGPFTVLKCPFQMAPCPFENLGRTLLMVLCHCLSSAFSPSAAVFLRRVFIRFTMNKELLLSLPSLQQLL